MPAYNGKYLFITEVAARIGIATATLYEWGKRGWFPCCDAAFGHRAVWHIDTIEKFLAGPDSRKAPPPGVGHAVGEQHGRTRWPKEFVAEVMRRHAENQSLRQIEAALGISYGAVGKIIRKERRIHE